MEIAQILGWMATVLFSLMVIPQMIKTIKSKDTSGVSIVLFMIFLLGNMIALIYAILIYQNPLIIKYSIAILTTLAYIGIYMYYYRKKLKIN